MICGSRQNIHKHHVFFGANRKISEREGCWVYLCARHHNMSDEGVHFNKELDKRLKEITQSAWQANNMASKADFIALFGRNYIE